MKFKFILISIFLFFGDINTINFEMENLSGKENIAPIVVIGSGPAGYTAGLYAARAGMETYIFGGELPGGQLTLTGIVENVPGVEEKYGYEIMEVLQKQVKNFGAKIIEQSITNIDLNVWPYVLTTSSGEKINALSIIIATGAAPRKLNIPGELEYWGAGVTACAVCDSHLFKGKNVVVVGGGDSAVEQAMHLAPFAAKVDILIRSEQMKAARRMQDKISEFDNIRRIYNKEVIEVIGNNEYMTGLKIRDILTGEVTIIPMDGLFLAIGHNPNTELFQNKIKLNKFGYIVLEDRSQSTSIPGVFAAGDVADSEYRQFCVSSGDGCKAALDSVRWLRSKGFTDQVKKTLKKNNYYRGNNIKSN